MVAQTVLIAGATGNVGSGAALSLAKRGARVVLLGRTKEVLEARAAALMMSMAKQGGDLRDGDVATLVVDFSSSSSTRDGAVETLDRFQEINALVLSAVTYAQNGPHIVADGHELMFATNVLGPYLFTTLLVDRLEQSRGMVLHVVAPFHKRINWEDLESIKDHQTDRAYNRTKTLGRAMAAEFARRYAGRISSVAFDPTFIIDRDDPDLEKRWPKGLVGLFWRGLAVLFARSPSVAGDAIAELVLTEHDRSTINGALFRLTKRVQRPDKAMADEEMGSRLWSALETMAKR